VSMWCGGPQGPLNRVCGVSMDVFFQGGSNDHRWPCLASAAGVIADLVKSCFGGLRGL
jgi:hypothetical protein